MHLFILCEYKKKITFLVSQCQFSFMQFLLKKENNVIKKYEDVENKNRK